MQIIWAYVSFTKWKQKSLHIQKETWIYFVLLPALPRSHLLKTNTLEESSTPDAQNFKIKRSIKRCKIKYDDKLRILDYITRHLHNTFISKLFWVRNSQEAKVFMNRNNLENLKDKRGHKLKISS
ncbi:unnamed protein product [Blepharisma stoltei]|uniref:Uncharacterized protein n=1 Tax=Blepharisma stoltei TaxID=1481888 RepID=A0AAU9IK28_9CILI|nr:unnamed protein product [Blepharisma stoltei]